MKHTDFYHLLEAIKKHEENELIAAVIAHGGEIGFSSEDAPVILASTKHAECASDYKVEKVTVERVDGHDWLTVFGVENEYGFDTEIIYAEPGHLSYITGRIPETVAVSDVSIPINFGGFVK